MKKIRLLMFGVPLALQTLVACGKSAENQRAAQAKDEPAAAMSAVADTAPSRNDKTMVSGAPLHSSPLRSSPLRLVQTILLPGVEGRFDHFTLDVQRRHLFVSALGNDTLEVLDLRTGKPLHRVQGLRMPTGVAFASEFNRVFTAEGAGESCAVLKGDTFASIQNVPGLPDADNVRYDATAKQIIVGYGEGALVVLNAATGQQVSSIKLAAHPESFQLEKIGARIFVNVPEAGHIAVVDRRKDAVVANWPTDNARANFSMALDEADHRLFVGCRQPAQVLVYDTARGNVVTRLSIAGDTDDLFWDAARKRLYVSCGEGFINVFGQQDADHYVELARIATAPGARTSFFSPDLGRFYLAVPHRGNQAAEIRVYAVPS